MELTSHQKDAYKAIKSFVENPSAQVFILKGYAGTGKTTMVKEIIPLISACGKRVYLMAPTGRAAKVMKDKTGCDTKTIHRGIYDFDSSKELFTKVNGLDKYQLHFKIKNDEQYVPEKSVVIVDEASMISSVHEDRQMFQFGTGCLIDDLLTYVQPCVGGKIIFVGDPAQLPPVGDNKSQALNEEYFIAKNIDVASFELTEVLRQAGESCIFANAQKIREQLLLTDRNTLVLGKKDGEVEAIEPREIIAKYCDLIPSPEIGEAVVIGYSNSLVKQYNDAIRRRYFPFAKSVVPSDVLQVVQNNYKIEVYNGDFIKVLDVSAMTETQSAPVWAERSGQRVRINVSLRFRDITFQTDDGRIISCKIIDDVLNSCDRGLTYQEEIALYINFCMRHKGLKRESEDYNMALRDDPYLNAIRAKYGYAITGHKSQGGEWKTVFVDYSGRCGLNDDCLRWMYTATTRASQMLYGVGMPEITAMQKLHINDIQTVTTLQPDALVYAEVEDVDLLPQTAKLSQKVKYLSVKDNLARKGYVIDKIECISYCDKYYISTPSGHGVYSLYYNGANLYSRYLVEKSVLEHDEIMELLQDESNIKYAPQYKPSANTLEALYNKIKAICAEEDITITNIVEKLDKYYVTYYFKTSGQFSNIKFCFDKNRCITYATPQSDRGGDDEKLKRLIDKLV